MDATSAMKQFLLSFKDGTVLRESSSGPLMIECSSVSLSLGEAPGCVVAAARALMNGRQTLSELSQTTVELGGPFETIRLLQYLRAWVEHGLICHTAPSPVGNLASIVPTSPNYEFQYFTPEPEKKYILSRFAYCRRVGSEMQVESPLGHARVVLHNWRASAVLHQLTAGATLEHLCETFDDIPGLSMSLFVSLLLCAETLSVLEGHEMVTEDDDTRRQWAFHDLLFHSRSRRGRHSEPYGKTEPFRDEILPCPAVKPAMSERAISLIAPDMDRVARSDVSLSAALETRCSIRSYGERPLTLSQLGEFLYRTARCERAVLAGPRAYEFDKRPYPSGGACYELELYIVSNSCDGLSTGLYHYHPELHTLYGLCELDSHERELLTESHHAIGAKAEPQVLIILASRFQRVSWAYESMAYALTLKHVGVVYQTMYLVATSMGLGGCALGGGNADTFARATGLDYLVEGSVGEFLLGSLARRTPS